MSKIIVQLIPDRTFGGLLIVVDSNGSQQGNGLSVLGKAAFNDAAQHGNPTASPLFLYGDTPTGTYSIKEITNGTYNGNEHSYGPNGVIKVLPVSGDAATAASNGRFGLLIHGGNLGDGGQLRRTNGCLRMRNDEIQYLKGLISVMLIKGDPVDVVEVNESGTASSPSFNNDTCGDDDPPPSF